ncbi:LysR substrate-binding domain-containing protein [Liquorilactobacillus satsumensis]|uniref:LysR substrate-binding domain-containing protein n=1 Tax=Liquorilactobacillus satsumensis TaxID=259059 RepID=UPI0039EB3514
MDFKQLKTFTALAKYKSYSTTARKLHVSQPTVTAHIQNLEEEFKVRLVTKAHNGYVPTDSGYILLSYAENMLNLYEKCSDALKPKNEVLKKSIRIGTTSIDTYMLATIARDFRFRYPNIHSFFSITNTEDAFKGLESGLVDIILVPLPEQHKEDGRFVVVDEVGIERLYLVANENNPLTKMREIPLDSLKKEKFIIREKGSDTGRILMNWLRQNKIDTGNFIRMQQYDNIKKGISEEIGISILPDTFFNAESSSLKPLDVSSFPIKRKFYVMTTKDKARIDAVLNFAELAKQAWF